MPSATASTPGDAPVEDRDILIIGAGLSGINTAHLFKEKLPHRSVEILESRDVIGGTWSFFKYPGFRSDSYITTFGLKWFPYRNYDTKIISAPSIVKYLQDAAEVDGTTEKIRFRHKVEGLTWKSDEQKWTLDVDADGTRKVFKANFIVACTGYYSYEKAMETTIPGIDRFSGKVVHPQWWPQDLDYSGKRVVIVGSGATAVTILPVLAKDASHVTMLQRSPSFVISQPTKDAVDSLLRMLLPESWAHTLTWYKDTVLESIVTQVAVRCPSFARWFITREIKSSLPAGIDADVHFNPRYQPFEQRLGICPDGDFFNALHQDNTEVVTDVIETVTPGGIQLQSGRELPADIIVTATGLYFQTLGGLKPVCDGETILAGSKYTWRGCMLESLPNMGFVMGYVTQSWTPGADAMARMLIRVITELERKGEAKVVPVIERTEDMPCKMAVNASSNYFVKAADRVPKVTGQAPWLGRDNLFVDVRQNLFGSLEDGLEYSGGPGGDKKTN